MRAAAARLVVFPELSLTGYELDACPVDVSDEVLLPIVEACSTTGSTAMIGAPVRCGEHRHIAMIAVTGAGAENAYGKTILGGDEARFFSPGPGPAVWEVDGWRVGLGICRDTSSLTHNHETMSLGIDLYVAGFVHHPQELAEQDRRARRITAIASVPVAFASAAGLAGAAYPTGVGRSCIWAADGSILARAGQSPGEVAHTVIRSPHRK